MMFMFRYTAIGVSAYWVVDTFPPLPGTNIDQRFTHTLWAKISPEIKEWIQTIASNTQDSDCDQ